MSQTQAKGPGGPGGPQAGDGRVVGSKGGITAAAMGGALMAILDITIVNVALSDIRASFGTPLDQIAWVSTGYMMANIVVIPMTGWFQRRFGFKRYFTFSILLFTLASALCGLAWNLPSLVAFRVLQGMGGGAIIPTSQSILFARYPKEEHGMAGALFGLGAITAPLLGPTLGGYLIDIASWHWIFLVNVPVGLVTAALAWRFIDQPGFKAPKERIDKHGILLLVIAMASLQYVLEEGNRDDWWESRTILVLSVVAFVALVTFVVHELETDRPVVDLRVFKNRSYTSATLVNFLVGLALFSANYLFSLYCGAVLRYSALDIGKVFLAAGTIQIFLMPLIGKFSGRIDGRKLVALGIAVTSLSLYLHGDLTSQSGYWDLVRIRMLMAFGLGFIFVPLSVLALSDLPLAQRGNATGLFNLTRELGGSIGTAWMSMMLTNRSRLHGTHLAEQVSLYRFPLHEQLGGLRARFSGLADPLLSTYSVLKLRTDQQALVLAFRDAFVIAAGTFAVSLLLVLLLRRVSGAVDAAGAH